ncbi:cupin domain-containing protein [Geodermatophilus sp. YIM 151500]|uniref:cupin domain-containing protein n=1 Tax=Geodermatophilus sp. YIM 151500 TaxID=2984531 RepID=UPI0021E4C29B|nr:cupin domain-containing protein [Geodermatophilus sp. YIM 151500]MCV2488426.1 cupin domain-containing protein [Geodermatophilus sp. YIM 151500]
MSFPAYPPDRYRGADGEVSAVLRRAGSPPELTTPTGNATHYLATGALTGGDFGLYRWDMGATPSGPGPHFHRSIGESFFVLTGTVRWYDGARWVDAGPGDFLYVPPGGVHGFRNESGGPASMLLLFTPGAPREDYFETLAHAARRDAMTEEERAAFYLRHDTFWVDPA